MYSLRIKTTHDLEFPSPRLGANFNWTQLTDVLRREIGEDAAFLLAEPILDPERAQTHWHVEALDDPKPISVLTPNQQELLNSRLYQLRSEIRAYATRLEKTGAEASLRLASALRIAIEVPDEADFVWSVSEKPILVAWGRKRAETHRATPVIVRDSPLKPTKSDIHPTVENSDRRINSTVRSNNGFESVQFAYFTFFLWTIFALLILLIGYHLIPACAVGFGGTQSIINTCISAKTSHIQNLRDINTSLREQIFQQQRIFAENQSSCSTSHMRDKVSKGSANNPQNDQLKTPAPNTEETRERAREAGGTSGKLSVTLSWNGKSDLDLSITCPDGNTISYKHNEMKNCGGQLQIDRNTNAETTVVNPVEHIFWQQEPPVGKYMVKVELYSYRETVEGFPIPFTVVVENAAEKQTYSGEIKTLKEQVTIAEIIRQ